MPSLRTLLAVSAMLVSPLALAQSSLSVNWEWLKKHRCDNTSPALEISGIPEGTASLAVVMNDLDFQNKDHGGGTVPHAGGATASLPEGALGRYLGPCPNNFGTFGHDYSITVRALAADGQTELGRGSATRNFSASKAK
ncbi:MAG: phospholipid-binding protein [Pseudomonadota bacterium]